MTASGEQQNRYQDAQEDSTRAHSVRCTTDCSFQNFPLFDAINAERAASGAYSISRGAKSLKSRVTLSIVTSLLLISTID
jgi:hypothetical protein